MQVVPNDLVSENLLSIHSTEPIATSCGLVFFDEMARRFQSAYKPSSREEEEVIADVGSRRFEIAASIAKVDTFLAKYVRIRFVCRMGIMPPREIIDRLLTTDEKFESLSLLDGLGTLDSRCIRDAIYRTRERFEDNDAWIWTTFALVNRHLELEKLDELASQLNDDFRHYSKAAQIAFRLTGMGSEVAKAFCIEHQTKHHFANNFAFETICWYGCNAKDWESKFAMHCAGEE